VCSSQAELQALPSRVQFFCFKDLFELWLAWSAVVELLFAEFAGLGQSKKPRQIMTYGTIG